MNWITAEVEVERLGERADQECFRQAGHTHQQRVPVGKESGQQALDDVMLAHDPLFDFVSELLGDLGHTLQ